MKKVIGLAIALVVLGVVGYSVYSMFLKPTEEVTVGRKALRPVNITIMTNWSQWGCDDFKRYFFAESGMPRAGVIMPSAAMQLNITDIVFIRELDINVWANAGSRGLVDGFIGQNRYNITYLCRIRALKPIEDPDILNLSKYIPDILKGYTEDGKLCWVSLYFNPYVWLISNEFAQRHNIPLPETWADLAKPEYLAIVLKGEKIIAAYPVTNRPPMINTVNVLLSKYGWEKGWTLLAVLFSGASRLEIGSPQARTTVSRGRTLLTVLEFDEAFVAYSMFPDKLELKFPRNETGFWLTPIAIASGTDEEGLDGMYRLIRWWLTDAQDNMIMNRSGWLFMPVLGWNNPSPRMVYKEMVAPHLYAPPVDLELSLGEAGNVIQLYADIIVTNDEIRKLIEQYVKKVAKLYLDKAIDLDTYYRYLGKLGEPIEFLDPLTRTTASLTLDKARELGRALRRGEVDIKDLEVELRNALLKKLSNLVESIA